MPNVINKSISRYSSASKNLNRVKGSENLNSSLISPSKFRNKISAKNTETLPEHLFKKLEVGKMSKKGKTFNDRPKLGRNEAKVVSIDFY